MEVDPQKLYDVRQVVNPAVYDFAQLFMEQPYTKRRFGCKCPGNHPKVLVFDGSTFAYKKAYDSDGTPEVLPL